MINYDLMQPYCNAGAQSSCRYNNPDIHNDMGDVNVHANKTRKLTAISVFL